MQGHDISMAVNGIRSEFAKVPKEDLEPADVERLDLDEIICVGAFKAFTNKYKATRDHYPRVLTEQTLSMPVLPAEGNLPPVVYTGRLDMLIQSNEGDWWIEDYKTTAQIDKSMLQHAWHDWQFMGYAVLASKFLGKRVQGSFVNFIQKPTIRRKKTETKVQYINRLIEWYADNSEKCFVRENVMYSKEQMHKFIQQLKHACHKYRQAWVEPDNKFLWHQNTSACKNKFGGCNMLPICSNNDHVSKMIYKVKQ